MKFTNDTYLLKYRNVYKVYTVFLAKVQYNSLLSRFPRERPSQSIYQAI